jgi:thermosome
MANQFGGGSKLNSEDTSQASGTDVRSANIAAGRAVAEAVRTTLGPEGMDKMLVSSAGDVTVTNDGSTVLAEMDVESPGANLIIEAAKTLEEDVGDGTTTAVTIAGELLYQSQTLLERGVHPTILARGYRQAIEFTKDELSEQARSVTRSDTGTLTQVAATAMNGTNAGGTEDVLARLVVDAALSVSENEQIDTDHVKVEKVGGGTIADSELIEGVIIGKERVNTEMPSEVTDARVAVLQTGLEPNDTEIETKVAATDPEQFAAFREDEEQQLDELVSQLLDLEVEVLFVRKGIADYAEHRLAREGIMAIRRCKLGDLEKVRRATGAKTASSVDTLSEEDLGTAGSVTQKDIGHDDRIHIEEVQNTKTVTLALRGGTDQTIDELERTIENGLGAVRTALGDGLILPGGGASEVELAIALRQMADSVEGREQLSIEAFADAVEVIPRTLAENAGANPLDTIVDLRSRHSDGEMAAGIQSFATDTTNMNQAGIVEPLGLKLQSLESAAEAVITVLRIDQVVSASNLGNNGSTPEEP